MKKIMAKKYSWIKPGVKVHWFDPDPQGWKLRKQIYTIEEVRKDPDTEIDDDTIILISNKHGEAEVLPSEIEIHKDIQRITKEKIESLKSIYEQDIKYMESEYKPTFEEMILIVEEWMFINSCIRPHKFYTKKELERALPTYTIRPRDEELAIRGRHIIAYWRRQEFLGDCTPLATIVDFIKGRGDIREWIDLGMYANFMMP